MSKCEICGTIENTKIVSMDRIGHDCWGNCKEGTIILCNECIIFQKRLTYFIDILEYEHGKFKLEIRETENFKGEFTNK